MWILIASSLVPMPLIQGWVMFVSVFCFVVTTSLMVMYIIGTHGGETSWITLVSASPGNLCMGKRLVLEPHHWKTAFPTRKRVPTPGMGVPWKCFPAQSKAEWARPWFKLFIAIKASCIKEVRRERQDPCACCSFSWLLCFLIYERLFKHDQLSATPTMESPWGAES